MHRPRLGSPASRDRRSNERRLAAADTPGGAADGRSARRRRIPADRRRRLRAGSYRCAQACAVSSASVAWTSCGRSSTIATVRKCRSSHAASNRSRPVLFGGGRTKYGSVCIEARRAGTTAPEAAQAPSASKGAPVCWWVQRSIRTFAGPQSKPIVVATPMQDRQVGDAAEVEDRHGRIGSAEHGAMKGRNERGSSAAGGDVAAPEVRDDIDAGSLGQQSRRVELNGVADAIELAGAMAHRLAVSADGANLFSRDAALFDQRLDNVGVDTDKRIGGQRGAVQFSLAPGCSAPEARPATCRRTVDVHGHQLAVSRPSRRTNDQRAIDPIERGAGHQADVERHASILPPGEPISHEKGPLARAASRDRQASTTRRRRSDRATIRPPRAGS